MQQSTSWQLLPWISQAGIQLWDNYQIPH
jgi:hypothetical protein